MVASQNSIAIRITALVLTLALLVSTVAAQTPQGQDASSQGNFRFSVTTELVLVNVVVRDKDGNFVHDLPREAFTVLEDGKAQTVRSFDVENTELAVAPPLPPEKLLNMPAAAPAPSTAAAPQEKSKRCLTRF